MHFKKIGFFIIIIASIFIINNLITSIYTLNQKKDLVDNARKELAQRKREQQELKNKLQQIEDPEFIEQEARNKLFMSRPGEGVIVVSEKDLIATEPAKPKVDKRPNWQKWWELFF